MPGENALRNSAKTLIDDLTGRIDKIHVIPMDLKDSFTDCAARFSKMEGTVVLASGGEHDAARYHILAARPWLTFKCTGSDVLIQTSDDSLWLSSDPLDALAMILQACKLKEPVSFLPTSAGLFGYFSYDLKNSIESLPKTAVKDTQLPEICLYAPSVLLVCDRKKNKTFLCLPEREKAGPKDTEIARKWFLDCLNKPFSENDLWFSGGSCGFYSPFSKKTYMEAVEKIKDYIASGDIYQVNFSQRFETDFSGSPYGFFSTLFYSAPAPFYAFVNAGDHFVVSTSPERFVLQQGAYVETRPIKGTRPRGENKSQDRAMAKELLSSPKDDAELSMIVDLMRNDLGRVCAAGSVEVAEHRRLEAYHNVFHLVSVVKGRLDSGKDSADLIRACFPGGSVTGCPRIRAMEIIDELEPCCRHVYTGSIGYVGFDRRMDLSIAIRTAVIQNSRMFFSVGGGVVFDSKAEAEYQETLHKGYSVMSMLEKTGKKVQPQPRIWINGLIKPRSEACLPVSDPGVAYGHGFFETIRVDNGRIYMLRDHLNRFSRAWKALFTFPEPDLSWQIIISRVLEANFLADSLCSVKLMAAARQDLGQTESAPHLVVSARPYTHRLDQICKPALDIAVYPHPRQSPLADHKTLNYLYYFLAGKWARQKGADEAVICNTDGSVSETNTANLLVFRGKSVIRPVSAHALKGIMEAAVINKLAKKGYCGVRQVLTPQCLFDADMVMVTNSLMGPVGVRSVDGVEIPCDPEMAASLRAEIFSCQP